MSAEESIAAVRNGNDVRASPEVDFKALAVLLLGSFFWGGALGDAVERIGEERKEMRHQRS